MKNVTLSGVENNIDIDVNMAATAYGRDSAIKELIAAITKEQAPGDEIGVFYVNKKATSRLLQTPGQELPSPLQTTDGFIHKITDKGSPVKTLPKNPLITLQFNRWFGNSKALNKDGSPMVLYHYTNGEQTVVPVAAHVRCKSPVLPVEGFSECVTAVRT